MLTYLILRLNKSIPTSFLGGRVFVCIQKFVRKNAPTSDRYAWEHSMKTQQHQQDTRLKSRQYRKIMANVE